MIAICVQTDGRVECIERTIASLEENLNLDTMVRVIHDDSADTGYRAWLRHVYGDRWRIIETPQRSGFGGAIRHAWAHLRDIAGLTHVVWWEDDFLATGKVPVYHMADLLDDRPEVVQVALQRQPWNSTEIAAGGLFKVHPEGYYEARTRFEEPFVWQRIYFTTNPCVYRRSLLDEEWPEGPNSEGRFGHRLLQSGTNGVPGDAIVFAFWGALDDPPRVEHIGTYRAGQGY